MTAKPIPQPTPETAEFWAGCAAGELRLQHCESCGHVQFPPRRLCSACFGTSVEWRRASGHGRIVSWSTVVAPGAPGFEAEVPFVSVFVRLDEGPMMLSVLRECDADGVGPDMQVEVIFEARTDDIAVPYFRPTDR